MELPKCCDFWKRFGLLIGELQRQSFTSSKNPPLCRRFVFFINSIYDTGGFISSENTDVWEHPGMPIKTFICYARKDEALVTKLKNHLLPLQRQGLIDFWQDREILPGEEWQKHISWNLNDADLILLLVSPDFMASDYCYGIEMQRALERQASGECIVIPVILRPVYWHGEPLGKLQALPTDGKPITGPDWHTLDSAFYNVVAGIYQILSGISYRVVKKNPIFAQTLGTRAMGGHQGAVMSVVLNKDGKILVSGSRDHIIKVWDLLTGKELCSLRGHQGTIHSIVLSRDDRILISGSQDKAIKMWDLLTGKELRSLRGHQGAIHSVMLSENDRTLVSGSWDHTIKVWDLLTGKKLRSLGGHPAAIWCMALNADSTTLVSGSKDYSIKVWDLFTGKKLYSLEGHQGTIHSVALNRDGRTLVSGSEDGTVKVWDFLTGEELRSLIHQGTIHGVALSGDGRTLASGSKEGTIKVWDLLTGEELCSLGGHTAAVRCVALSEDGTTLASGGENGTIEVWKI